MLQLGAVASKPAASRGRFTLRVTAMAAATTATVPPAVIIGAGRVGAALERMGDGKDTVRGALHSPSAPSRLQSLRRTELVAPCSRGLESAACSDSVLSSPVYWLSTTQVVRRNEAVPATGASMPILVATRNDSLEGIIASTPAERRKDLVFMQVCETV